MVLWPSVYRRTLVLDKVWPTIELALVVGHAGLTGDRRRSTVWQGASHLLALWLLHRAVHAVELRT